MGANPLRNRLLFFLMLFSCLSFGLETSTLSPTDGYPNALPLDMARPETIYIALLITNLISINEKANNFEAEMILTLRWKDPSLAFNRQKMGTARLEYNEHETPIKLSKIWNPEIVIPNLEKAIKIQPGLFINEDGVVEYIRNIDGVFSTTFNLRSFPFDDENLSIYFLSKFYNKEQLVFDATQEDISRTKIAEGVSISGWKINYLDASWRTVRGWDGNFYAENMFTIKVSRNPFGHLVVLIPLMIIMIMPTYLTLYIKDVELIERLEAWAGSILALVATSFTLNLRYPTLEPDSIVNRMLLIFFCFQFLMIVITVTLFYENFTEKFTNQNVIKNMQKFCQWSIPIGFIILMIVSSLLVIYSRSGPSA